MARGNPYTDLYGVTYDPDGRLDGKFQGGFTFLMLIDYFVSFMLESRMNIIYYSVIGEIESGWNTLIEIESALVQPLAYYYPNNQHLLSYMDQTGDYDNPELRERIALGLKTDTYVPGLMEAQLKLDQADPTTKVYFINKVSHNRVIYSWLNMAQKIQKCPMNICSMKKLWKEYPLPFDLFWKRQSH